ncbi:MAG: hypothetical protein AAF436_08120 [Myxococcota bacterium]
MSSSRLRRTTIVAGLAAQTFLVATIVFSARSGAAPSTVTIALGVSFVPYVATVWACGGWLDRAQGLRIALGSLAVMGAALIFAPPVLSDDVYRFVWEGRLWGHGFNPYRLPPDASAVSGLRDSVWESINNKPLASIYPPLSQALFFLIELSGGGVVAAKVLALGGHLASTVAVARLSTDPRAPLLIALNPLLLSAAALDGHFDLWVGLAIVLAAWGIGRHRAMQAAVAALVAVGLKVVGLVLAPLFLRTPRALVVFALGSVALLMPMLVYRPANDATSGAVQFAERWQGNESLFAGVDWLARQALSEEQAMLVARIVVITLVFTVGLLVSRRHTPAMQGARIIVWATLLLSPQVHPWYLAWLLPLEVAAGRFAGIVWSAAALVAYAPLDRWVADGIWEPTPTLHLLEYLLVALALLLDRGHSAPPKHQ